jgi:ethanolamine utilization protein EutN
MQLGQVIGTATSTVRHPTLAGWKLLLVQLLGPDGRSPDGEPVLAIDRLGAGRLDTVIVTNDGKATREMIGSDNTPARWSVLGIKDS